MGTGKTGTAILMARQKFLKEKRLLKTLIVSPPVTLSNWRNEWKMWSKVPYQNVHVLDQATGAKKVDYFNKKILTDLDGNIVITNYEAFTVNMKLLEVLLKWKPELIIFDESHYLKSIDSQRTKRSIELADRAEYKILLSGTPILNKVTDIFSQFRIMDGGKQFGTNFFVFQSKYMVDHNAGWKGEKRFPDWQPNPKIFNELNDKIYSHSLRILMKDCIDLPDLVKVTELVDFGPDQKVAYKEMNTNLIAFIQTQKDETQAVVAQMALTKALRLLQIATGYVETEEGTIHEFKNNPRLDRAKELLEQLVPSHKVIVWCSYRHNYKMIERVCKELGVKYVFLTGNQDSKDKAESIETFQTDPECKVIIANRASGGVGCNLTAASYSIVYSRNFSLGEELQSEARNYRGGSQIHSRIVKIDLAIKDSLDEQVLIALKNKHKISTDILDMIKE